MPVLQLRNIQKRFLGVHALKGVSLDVHPGEVVALLGANGAGNSTLMKIAGGTRTAPRPRRADRWRARWGARRGHGELTRHRVHPSGTESPRQPGRSGE